MRCSVITPNFNGELFLEQTINTVLEHRENGIDLEYIVVDGGSTDKSHSILEKYRSSIDRLIIEKDDGPADAINKGLRASTGDVVAWLNADDVYYPKALQRVIELFKADPSISFAFGKCLIIDEKGSEIREGITGFKEFFFPLNSRFTYQCINYISQPAMFFSRNALLDAGLLRTDMVAAWDYEFILRLWRQGKGVCIQGEPLSAFRWHVQSISGQNFSLQFKEEFDAAVEDAGKISLQALIHAFVRWGIVGAYNGMKLVRSTTSSKM
ncbi:glycosyltransferase family 2 protein [Desulfosediminicola flagellatus]|uniref:glycosyltransferase family 2 protein n=1 Tax=Desulfosediminicola flagellatus TaxID=2569541 RepID=UPI0010AD1DD0|nr:glycosyltransferase family 2 protein [Desulfosediminicola flagellatus]